FIRESDSLKDKRRILSSLIQRIRHRFNVSIAEVGSHDLWRRATLGVALVTNDRRYAEQVLSTIVEFVGRSGRGADGLLHRAALTRHPIPRRKEGLPWASPAGSGCRKSSSGKPATSCKK